MVCAVAIRSILSYGTVVGADGSLHQIASEKNIRVVAPSRGDIADTIDEKESANRLSSIAAATEAKIQGDRTLHPRSLAENPGRRDGRFHLRGSTDHQPSVVRAIGGDASGAIVPAQFEMSDQRPRFRRQRCHEYLQESNLPAKLAPGGPKKAAPNQFAASGHLEILHSMPQ